MFNTLKLAGFIEMCAATHVAEKEHCVRIDLFNSQLV